MRFAVLIVVGLACLVACKEPPKVQLIKSACADFAGCVAECDQQIVVACDRAAPLATDDATRRATYRKSYEMWARTCDVGMPEACLYATHTSLRSRGQDPARMSRQQIAADKEACEYFEIYGRATGAPLTTPCP